MSLLHSRFFAYGVISTSLASAIILSAYNTRQNFYAAAVQLSSSSGNLMVLANFVLFLIMGVGLMVKGLFFGRLRRVEVEHFWDRSWFMVTESMLALTFFRDDLNVVFAGLFIALYFLRVFHWIAGDRIDYMDQIPPPGPPTLFILRMTLTLTFLIAWDLLALELCLRDIRGGAAASGGQGQWGKRGRWMGSSGVLFAAEFAITLIMGLSRVAKFIINLVDMWKARRAGEGEENVAWEGKSMVVFYVDLFTDAMRFAIYSIFFWRVFMIHNSLPFNHIHNLFASASSFIKRLSDLLKYRSATRNMDIRYPDATAEDIAARGGESCVICREEMVPGSGSREGRVRGAPYDTPKKLGCGHCFHFHCLRSWLERQQTCPTCRQSVLPSRQAAAPPTPTPNLNHAPNGAAAPAAPHALPEALRQLAQATPAPARPHNPLEARAPPQGPLGIWDMPFPTQQQQLAGQTEGGARPSMLPPFISTNQLPTPAINRPPSPASHTPLSSQAPTVFSPLGGPGPSTMASSSSNGGPSITIGSAGDTMADLARAAALRRAKMMEARANGNAAPIATPVDTPSETPQAGKPYLVPAFTSRCSTPHPWASSPSTPNPGLLSPQSTFASPTSRINHLAQQLEQVRQSASSRNMNRDRYAEAEADLRELRVLEVTLENTIKETMAALASSANERLESQNTPATDDRSGDLPSPGGGDETGTG